MTEETLNISLENSNVVDDPYWLHMEVVETTVADGMTVSEAADMIDSVYNITPCEQQDSNSIWQQGDTTGREDIWAEGRETQDAGLITQEQGEENLEAQLRFAEAILAYDAISCDTGDSAGLAMYTVQIKVFRSHQDELYKLQMSNGIASPPMTFEEGVVHTIDVENAESITLDNPIIKNPVVVWQGDDDGPALHINGNTIYWEGEYTGTLRAEFGTKWDQLTITVTGEFTDSEIITGTDTSFSGEGWYSGTEDAQEITGNNNTKCTVLGFYHYQFEELILDEPEEDKSTTEVDKISICNFIVGTAEGEDDPGQDCLYNCIAGCPEEGNAECVAACHEKCDNACQRHVLERIVCECGSAPEQTSNSYYEAVNCPAGTSLGSTLQGTKEFTTYKDCGYRDEASDPAVYLEKCCEEWPFVDKSMPKCREITTVFSGTGEAIDRSDYPENTDFVTVAPADGQCGEMLVEQVITAKQCCDGVDEIVWDYERSARVISDGFSGTVHVIGGKSPYTWKVRGQGFAFNSSGTVRDAITNVPEIDIYLNDSCGPAAVFVEDGCSSASEYVLSTAGTWVKVRQWGDATDFSEYPSLAGDDWGGIAHTEYVDVPVGYAGKYAATYAEGNYAALPPNEPQSGGTIYRNNVGNRTHSACSDLWSNKTVSKYGVDVKWLGTSQFYYVGVNHCDLGLNDVYAYSVLKINSTCAVWEWTC